jgi:hypothetical protein
MVWDVHYNGAERVLEFVFQAENAAEDFAVAMQVALEFASKHRVDRFLADCREITYTSALDSEISETMVNFFQRLGIGKAFREAILLPSDKRISKLLFCLCCHRPRSGLSGPDV